MGKNGSKGKDNTKGKGKAMSKGHHQCSILPSKVSVKGSFDKSPFNVFNDIKGSIKGSDAGRLSALPGDRKAECQWIEGG